jgi:ubiquinone/menaquinone biosynthesis C-methylase UbiE
MEEGSFLNPPQALLALNLHEGQLVVDFGAGSGFFTRSAAREVGPEGEVWALDSNGDMLTRIKNLAVGEGLHNVQILRGAIDKKGGTALPAQHFDVAVAANVLFAVEDKAGLVEEIKRVLKRTGRALIIDWSGSHGGLGPHQDHIVSESSARKLFEENGFTYVEPVQAGAYHWGFIVWKSADKAAQ